MRHLSRKILSFLRYGRYQHGDKDLSLIKRISLDMRAKEEAHHHNHGGHGPGGGGAGSGDSGNSLIHETETIATGLTNISNVERVYLTGIYRDKYRYLSNKVDRQLQKAAVYHTPPSHNGTPARRKIKSAYPMVRIS